jgi:cyanate lyase
MATLNAQETQALKDAVETLTNVIKRGFDPSSKEMSAIRMLVHLEKARDSIDLVVTMKGKYQV